MGNICNGLGPMSSAMAQSRERSAGGSKRFSAHLGGCITSDTNGGSKHVELERFLADAPIFYQPWWLDAVSPGTWDYVVVRRDSQIAAVLPYAKRTCRLGRVRLDMPPLTQTLGPWLRRSSAPYSEQLQEQNELMLELIDALPRHDLFQQAFHYSTANWLPFYWRGFRQTTHYTYVLEDLDDLDAIWKGFDPVVRWNIRKAEKSVEVVEDFDIDRFLEVRDMSFERQGLAPTHSWDFLRRVDEACEAHNARKMFIAIDAKKRIHSVLSIVWTGCAAYYLLGGGDPELRRSGANHLLVWKAIQFARRVARTFDFEMAIQTEPIERFFRLFGGRLVPYFQVVRRRSLLCNICDLFRSEVLHRVNSSVLKGAIRRAGRWVDRRD